MYSTNQRKCASFSGFPFIIFTSFNVLLLCCCSSFIKRKLLTDYTYVCRDLFYGKVNT